VGGLLAHRTSAVLPKSCPVMEKDRPKRNGTHRFRLSLFVCTESKMKASKLVVVVLAFTLRSISAFGQGVGNSSNAGTPQNAIFHGSDIDAVQLNNGGLSVDIPLGGTPGRGLSTGYRLIYNSRTWYLRQNNCPPDQACPYYVTLTK